MLKSLEATGLEHLPNRNVGVVSGLNVVHGPVGVGKTMLFRDCLMLLLSGRIPSKRKVESLGKRHHITATLCDGDKSLTINRANGSVNILEHPEVSSAASASRYIEDMVGMSSKQLQETCYVSGLTLPDISLRASALQDLVREFVQTSRLKSLGQSVNRRIGELNGSIDTNMQVLATPFVDGDEVKAEVSKLEASLRAYSKAVSDGEEGRRVSERVLACHDADEVSAVVAQMRSVLGDLADDPNAENVIDNMTGYRFLRDLLLSDTGPDFNPTDDPKGWAKAIGSLPNTVGAYGTALGLGDRLDQNPASLRQALTGLRSALSLSTSTAENRQKAQAYIARMQQFQATVAELQTKLSHEQARLELAERQGDQTKAIRESTTHLRNLAGTYECLLPMLQPGGRTSVEKAIVESVMSGVLAEASRMINTAGIPGELSYAAGIGLGLKRDGSECLAAELSGGEITLVSLAVRLVTCNAFSRVPFMVLDDITGSLGRLTPTTCGMLSDFAVAGGFPIILLTQDRNARGDHFIPLD